jgi:hypothetical protein
MEVEEGKMLFKLRTGKGSVSGFRDAAGVVHVPGDVVELPASYLGEKWLEPVEKAKKVVAAPSKVESVPEKVADIATPGPVVPLEKKKKAKSGFS